jgi:hypothetical protein
VGDFSLPVAFPGDNVVCPVQEGAHDRPFMLEVVVGIEVQILVGVRGFSVYCDPRFPFIPYVGAGVEKGKFAI